MIQLTKWFSLFTICSLNENLLLCKWWFVSIIHTRICDELAVEQPASIWKSMAHWCNYMLYVVEGIAVGNKWLGKQPKSWYTIVMWSSSARLLYCNLTKSSSLANAISSLQSWCIPHTNTHMQQCPHPAWACCCSWCKRTVIHDERIWMWIFLCHPAGQGDEHGLEERPEPRAGWWTLNDHLTIQRCDSSVPPMRKILHFQELRAKQARLSSPVWLNTEKSAAHVRVCDWTKLVTARLKSSVSLLGLIIQLCYITGTSGGTHLALVWWLVLLIGRFMLWTSSVDIGKPCPAKQTKGKPWSCFGSEIDSERHVCIGH